jgi:class 3 adenylate cyclase/predicted ATPase
MALTDSRGLATIGKTRVLDSELHRLASPLVEARRPSTDRLRLRGADLFDRVFPENIRSFLTQSPRRLLQLQLAEELLAIAWEHAFDGQSFLGEKFAVARQILSASEFPETRQLRVQGARLRVFAVEDAGLTGAASQVPGYTAALDAIEGLSVTRADMRDATAVNVRRLVGDFDVLHCIARRSSPENGRGQATALLELFESGPMPPLLLVELEATTGDRHAEQFVRTLPLINQRIGGSCILRVVGDGLRPDFSKVLYSDLVEGQPLAFAVATARQSAKAMISVFYGDGAQSPFRVARRPNTDDSHRQVTIMSYDLVNSTQVLATIGAERYTELLGTYHKRCAEIVRRHGGTAQDARGDDGIMCYFGLPVAMERSAEQCILAAFEIQGAVRSLEVETRIGITTGEVAVRDNLPHGVPIHMAARLQSIAKPGTVVVSEATRNLVKETFDFELLDARPSLKGIDQPGNVYRVLGARSSGSLEQPETVPSFTPFVGRANELRLLREHWIAAVSNGVRLIRVSGDAGVGKSRLIREFRSQLASEGASIIECRCTHDHSASAFHPIIDLLHRSLQISDRESAEAKLDKVVAAFPAGAQLDDAPALIARLFSLPFEARFGRLAHPAERLRERTLEVLLAWFRIRASETPTCLIVEDANWADPSSAEFLRRLLAVDKQLPLLVILTLRSDAELHWNLPAESGLIELRGLDPESARALVVAASGDARLPKDVVRALAERGDGVPLFIEESTRMAIELGTDSHSSLEALRRAVPSTIQDLLMARLDRLGHAKQIAQIGGTIGREFPLTLLAAVAESERIAPPGKSLLERLQVLTASGMLIEKGGIQDRSYYFKHALMRDAAYNSLWEKDRLRLHRAIAEVVAAKFPELAESRPELLAYHYGEAHHDREALAYWERAARHAASRSANYEAIDHLKRGLALLARLPEGSERERVELRLLLLLAARLIASEGYGAVQVENVYSRALVLCRKLADDSALIKVQLGLEGYHFMRGNFALAREFADQAAAMAARGSDPIPQLQARWAIANIVMHQGNFVAAVEQMDKCLTTYENLTHRPSAVQDPGVMCLCYSAWGLWEMGYPDRALQRAVRAVDLANTLRHSFSMGVAFGFRSTVHHFRGEFDDALIWAERAIEVCSDAGFIVWLAHAKVMHGRILAELGEPVRGVEEMSLGYEMWADTGALVTQPFYLAMQSEGLALARRFDEALTVIDRAMQVVEEHGERYYEAEIRRLRGEFTLRSAGAASAAVRAEAERWFLDAIKVAQLQRLGSLELRSALSLAELWMERDPTEAAPLLAFALGRVQGGDETSDPRRARSLLQGLRASESVAHAASAR